MKQQYFNITPDCEIVASRTIDAIRELVFKAWTDPSILQKWWGPAGFTNTFHKFDLRVGGTWKFTMHGPEKGNYENEVVFEEIIEPELIVWDRISQPLFRMVVTFEATNDGKTTCTFRQQFKTKEACDKIRPFVIDKNEENFDKLESELSIQG